jgi:peptidoglycan/xylan/chitin deacetylase (PgdA/CDA1 family)
MTKSRLCLDIIILLAVPFVNVVADLAFMAPDISPDDRILFSARVSIPGEEGFSTLFSADASTGEMVQLTFYPESITVLDDGRRLQIRNRFGIFMTDRDFGNLAQVPGFPAFTRGSAVQQGRMVDSRPSPDGNMILYLSPTSPARGDLILFDLARQTEILVARSVEYSVDTFPARWSPDSQYFVYSRTDDLFYFSTEQARAGRIPDETWRRIGKGRISHARWSANGSLYILRERSMYRIMAEEFFTQAIYSGIVPPGIMVGKTPFPFDPNFDSFWISPDGAKVLLCKDGRNIFLYWLDPDDFGRETAINAMPYLFLQGNTLVAQVIWPNSDEVTIFTGSLKNGKRLAGAYRIKVPIKGAEALSASFTNLAVNNALSLSLAPNEARIAIVKPDGVEIRHYSDWRLDTTIQAPGTLHAVWVGSDRLIIAGSSLIELVNLTDSRRRLINVAQADRYGWVQGNPGTVAIQVRGQAYNSPASNAAWQPVQAYTVAATTSSSANYRVYLDSLSAGMYRNMIMIRSVRGLGTTSLLPPPARAYKPFPDRDEAREAGIFNHGSRIRRREVALVFDAYDSAEGLTTVLETLRVYGFTATFFLNGEFIRRNPGAAKLIAESGHHTGNMFFSVFDATDARYRVDAEFVKRGLARTEDEYFKATGAELSLLWHPPYYATSTMLLAAATEMNYQYIGRDVDPMDWVGRYQGSISLGLYASTHDIIERTIAAVQPGSIIPIRIGAPDGGRHDYLFNELPLLINALMAEGYDIVPVSRLMENAE